MRQFKFIAALAVFLLMLQSAVFAQQSIVDKYGRLQVKGNRILGEKGDTVQLRGMSLFWSQAMSQFYNKHCIKWLKDDWKCTIVRAAMSVEWNGYLQYPEEEKESVMKVVDAAIEQGIYVIIDYHSHKAHTNHNPAVKFFSEMAQKYGKYPNVIYELYNEPLKDANWSKDLKPYAEKVIKEIRKYDPDNLIIMGTRQWSQMVSEAAEDRIDDPNIAYTLHFYAPSHGDWLREEAKKAMDKGVALFVSEMGSCDASGNGNFSPADTKKWFEFMDKYKLSWCNWSVADKVETASILKPNANGRGNWRLQDLTESGLFIREELIKKNTPVLESLSKSGTK